MCLRKLTTVNDTLETLGAPKEYQRLRNWIIRIIIGMIGYVFYDAAFFMIYVFLLFFPKYVNNIFCATLQIFLIKYPIYVIILDVLISAAIFGLVLYTFIFVSYFY